MVVLGISLPCAVGHGEAFEIFARGSASRNYLQADSFVLSVSAAMGVALTIIPRVRLEARYTNASSLQNRMAISGPTVGGTLNDIMTQTSIYSLGIDFDILGPRSAFQPFIYVGAGYVQTDRSAYYLEDGAPTSTYLQDPTQQNISANAGLGFRIRIANSLAFELEVFAYGVDIHKPNPLINAFASVGIRLFI